MEIPTIGSIIGEFNNSFREFHGQYPWEYAQINHEYSVDVRNIIANHYSKMGWNYVYHSTSSENGERYGWTSFMLSMDKLEDRYCQEYHVTVKKKE